MFWPGKTYQTGVKSWDHSCPSTFRLGAGNRHPENESTDIQRDPGVVKQTGFFMLSQTNGLEYQRTSSWLRMMARLRNLTLCEPEPGNFYVFETNEPGNRFPLVGSVGLRGMVAFFEKERTGHG